MYVKLITISGNKSPIIYIIPKEYVTMLIESNIQPNSKDKYSNIE